MALERLSVVGQRLPPKKGSGGLHAEAGPPSHGG